MANSHKLVSATDAHAPSLHASSHQDGGADEIDVTGLTGLPTRASLGLATGDSPQFTGIELGHASDTTLARIAAGRVSIEGNEIYRAGGTDVPVADGGTGASTSAGAATNLGLGTGDSPQHAAINLGHASDTTIGRTSAGIINVEGKDVYLVGGTDVAIADGGTGASTKAAAFDALSPMTTQDDIIIGGASGTGTRLAKGSDGQVLTVDPTTHHLVWATPASSGGFPSVSVNRVETDETQSGNDSYADLATSGPSVTVTVNTKVRVHIGCRSYTAQANQAPYGAMGFAMSIGNTLAAAAARSVFFTSGAGGGDGAAGRDFILTGLTPGSTVFTAKYDQFGAAGTTHYLSREISVELLD